jgi:hypothetical protein
MKKEKLRSLRTKYQAYLEEREQNKEDGKNLKISLKNLLLNT